MPEVKVKAQWRWTPLGTRCVVYQVEGPPLPPGLQSQIVSKGPAQFESDSSFARRGAKIANAIAQSLPHPEPLELGGVQQVESWYGEISVAEGYSGKVRLLISIEYSNGKKHRQWIDPLEVADLPPVIRAMAESQQRDADRAVQEWFIENFSGSEADPAKWERLKTEVFISYRSHNHAQANRLFIGLGDLENRTLFLPRIDHVDMQAGNWLDQLMELVRRCEVFIPVLSSDYLSGPFSRPELDQALRSYFSGSGKRIVPVLTEGAPEDYRDHYLGGIHMVKALEGITNNTVEEVARLALGVSSNPYEQ